MTSESHRWADDILSTTRNARSLTRWEVEWTRRQAATLHHDQRTHDALAVLHTRCETLGGRPPQKGTRGDFQHYVLHGSDEDHDDVHFSG